MITLVDILYGADVGPPSVAGTWRVLVVKMWSWPCEMKFLFFFEGLKFLLMLRLDMRASNF